MIKTKTIHNIYEHKQEKFITSDGVEHNDLRYAELYELYKCKLNEREIFVPENKILDFENIEQVKDFVKDHYYNDTELMFNYDDLKFPNTYVFVQSEYENIENNGEDDVWLRERTKLEINTLEKFKETILKSIFDFK